MINTKKRLTTAIILSIISFTVSAQDTVKLAQPLTHFNDKSPVFNLQGEQLTNKNRKLSYYALTGYREGVEPINGPFGSNFSAQIDKEAGTHRIKMYNLSIQDMFTHGLRRSNQVILDVKDPSKYRYELKYGPKKEWLRKNGYCFEFLMPPGVIKGIQPVDDELARLFKIKYGMEKRMVKVVVLKRTSTEEKFGTTATEVIQDDINGIYKGVPITAIASPWRDILPFFDETGYKGLIDVDLNVKINALTDLPAVRRALQRYDLDLKEEMREIEVFVIKEVN